MKLTEAIIKKWFCPHKWVSAAEYRNTIDKRTTGILYVCEHCGKFKKISV